MGRLELPWPRETARRLQGHFATFTLGYVAFQVFKVDFVAADMHDAGPWNTEPPSPLARALTRIWPQLPAMHDVALPTQAFAKNHIDRPATWDGALRRAF